MTLIENDENHLQKVTVCVLFSSYRYQMLKTEATIGLKLEGLHL